MYRIHIFTGFRISNSTRYQIPDNTGWQILPDTGFRIMLGKVCQVSLMTLTQWLRVHLTDKKYYIYTIKISGCGVWQQLVMYRIILDVRFYRIQDNTGYWFVPDTGYLIPGRIPDIRYSFNLYDIHYNTNPVITLISLWYGMVWYGVWTPKQVL